MVQSFDLNHPIFSLYPMKREEIYMIHRQMQQEKQYMPMYFLDLYTRKNIRMKFQITYLKHHLTNILSFNIPKNREDLIMKMIWDFWIQRIPEKYEYTSIAEFEKDMGISFSTLEEELNRILVYTLGEKEITYDSNEIIIKIKNKEKRLK